MIHRIDNQKQDGYNFHSDLNERDNIMSENIVKVKKSDLPISCPEFTGEVWNEHPRVYIELSEKQKTNKCPYCGNRFELETK
jgi:uncharacterized Zn-finger protein